RATSARRARLRARFRNRPHIADSRTGPASWNIAARAVLRWLRAGRATPWPPAAPRPTPHSARRSARPGGKSYARCRHFVPVCPYSTAQISLLRRMLACAEAQDCPALMIDKLDATGRKWLSLRQANAREPAAILARKLKLARSTVVGRLARLERDGVIAGYGVRLGRRLEDAAVRAYCFISVLPKTP